MTKKTISMNDRLHEYLLSVSLREPSVLRRLREETARHPRSNMQIAPEQGQFMALLVRLMGAKKTLDVGVFTGYSALCVALALPPEGKLIGCDVSEEWTTVARRYWAEAGVAGKVDLYLAPALETMDRLLSQGEAGSFDFAFIDADKISYDDYYEHTLRLLRLGGLVAIDNVFLAGRVADPAIQDKDTRTMRAFNEKLHEDPRIALSFLPIADGLTLALKLS